MGVGRRSDDAELPGVCRAVLIHQANSLNILKNNDRELSAGVAANNATWVRYIPYRLGSITNSAQISVSVNPTGLAAGSLHGDRYGLRQERRKHLGSRDIDGDIRIHHQFDPHRPYRAVAPPRRRSAGHPAPRQIWPATRCIWARPQQSTSSSLTIGNTTSYTASNLGVGQHLLLCRGGL